jgi:hypothetical protein
MACPGSAALATLAIAVIAKTITATSRQNATSSASVHLDAWGVILNFSEMVT